MQKISATLIFIISLCALSYSQNLIPPPEPYIFDVNDDFREEIRIDQESILDKINATVSKTASKKYEKNIFLPIAPGVFVEFEVFDSPVLTTEFKEIYPEIRNYDVKSIDRSITGNITLSPSGTYATLLTPDGPISIFPKETGNPNVCIIEKGISEEDIKQGSLHCAQHETPALSKSIEDIARSVPLSNGSIRKLYTIAIVATGEYYEFHGASTSSVNTAIASAVGGIGAIFSKDLAVNFALIPPVFFTNPLTDPFIPDNSGGDGRTVQAGRVITQNFSTSSFDIGHVFHKHDLDDGWSSGGLAQLAVVCNNNTNPNAGVAKARGWSGSFNPQGNSWLQLAAHEFAHMFNATHTFNGTGESCTDNIGAITSYEIGSGTTIMSYNGICDENQNIPASGEADNYFHSNSLIRMIEYINSEGTCANETVTGNTVPLVNANPCGLTDYTIPVSTPFTIRGEATDDEGDELTYCWEQYDEDGSGTPTQGFIGNQASTSNIAPVFRSYPPTTDPVRTFPNMASVIEGTQDPFDVLPRVGRTINYKFTVRDNNNDGGAITIDDLSIRTNTFAGPLTILTPFLSQTVEAGTDLSVTWNPNNSENLCAQVNIYLSLDGGNNFPFVLAENVDYASGAMDVFIPAAVTSSEEARVMIKCIDNDCIQFFALSPGNFTINSSCFAEPNYVCPPDDLSFNRGDPGLDLDIKACLGDEKSTLGKTIFSSSPNFPLVINNLAGTGCVQFSNRRTERITFKVLESGTYTLLMESTPRTGITLFDAATFNENNPCASFVASSISEEPDNFISWTYLLPLALEECKEYIVVFYSFDALPSNTAINTFSGPGQVIEINDNPDPDYSTTFIAVNNDDSTISMISETADFTMISPGIYTVYSVSYKSGGITPPPIVIPSEWIGETTSGLVETGNCVNVSTNSFQLEVISSCLIEAEAGTQSPCDPETNTYSQEIIITYESAPTTGRINVNGVDFDVTQSPQTILLEGLPADAASVDVSIAFSDDPACSFSGTALFTAPENCCPINVELGDDIMACIGDEIILDAGPDGVIYTWFQDGNEIQGETSNTLSVTENGNYTVIVENATGCEKPDAVNVTINENPEVELGEDGRFCEGDTYTIMAQTSESSVSWFKDGVQIMGESDVELIVSEAGNYRAVVENASNCTAEDEIIISVDLRPVVELGDNIEECGGVPVTLNAGSDGTIYTWFLNDTEITGETNATLAVTQSGIYDVIVENMAGCTSQDQLEVNFFDAPEVAFEEDKVICEGDEVLIEVQNSGVSTFQWFLDGTPIMVNEFSLTTMQGGQYVITAENGIGCEDRDTINITVNPLPMVELGEDVIACIGSEVTLDAGVDYTFEWRKDGVPLPDETGTIIVNESGAYSVTVSDNAGCSSTDVVNVSFVPGPTLDVGEDQQYCEDEMYTILAQTDGDNIQWYKDGVLLPGETDLALDVAESGEYSAIVIGSNNCEVSDAVTIVIEPLPIVDIGEDLSFCEGESGFISAITNGIDYKWYKDGVLINDTDQEITVTEPGVYSLEASTVFGCTASDEITVTVFSRPTITLDPGFDICEGETVTITANSNGISFSWFFNGTLIPGATGTSIDVDQAGEYTCVTQSVENCTNEDMTTVTSRPSPVVDLGEDTELCPDGTITLDAGNHDTYVWCSGETTQSIVVNSSNPTSLTVENYCVTVTNTFNCSTSDEVNITFLPVVQASIISESSGVCPGESMDLIASGGLNYSWTDPNNTLSTISGSVTTANPTETTTYEVLVTDNCSGNQDVASITVEAFMRGSDVSAGKDTCVLLGSSINLNATGGIRYEWENTNGIIGSTSVSDPEVAPTVPTTYMVTITDANGCEYTDQVNVCIIEDPLSIFQAVNMITPNGDNMNDVLEFRGLEAFPDNRLEIYNRWGGIVFEADGYQSGSNRLWDGTEGGQELPAGTYYYILTFDEFTIKSALTIVRDRF